MSEITISCKDVSIEYLMSSHRYSGLKDMLLHPKLYFAGRKQFQAVQNVSLEVPAGESIALIGHNGCGKSTLLKAIAGVIVPQKGSISVKGRIGPMIELGAGFDQELSGLENIQLSCMLMGLSRKEIESRMGDIIAFADLGKFIDAPLKNYSSGMTARIGFACATAISPDVLLVDEVLSVGDANFGLKCLNRINELRKNGTTVVLVSHDMNAVRSFCQRVIVLNEGKMVYDGDVEDGIDTYMDVMHERLTRSNPEQAKQEFERRKLLKLNARERNRPVAQVHLKIIQDGVEVSEVDVARSFGIEIDATFKHHQKIRDGLTFGIALIRQGVVLLGFNNLDLKFPDPADRARSSDRISIRYELQDGLPQIAAQDGVEVYCGIHDDHISRELFFGSVLTLGITNSLRGQNRHRYLLDLPDVVTSFQVTT